MAKNSKAKFFNANIIVQNGKVFFSEAVQSVIINQHADEIRKVNSRKLARLVNKAAIVIK